MSSSVLKGYGPIPGLNCGICGENYIALEATANPDVVKLSCWCGATTTGPRSHPPIEAVLSKQPSDGYILCPAEDCDVRLREEDLPAQIAHMEASHPDIIAAHQAHQALP